MANVVYYVAMSVDGMIADPEGGVGWLNPFEQPGEDYGYAAFLGRLGALVMGSGTYEWILNAGVDWPYAGLEAVVMTTRALRQPPGGSVRFASGDPADVARSLRATHDKDVWLVGGGKLAAAFAERDLIDEYVISVIPVVLGAGIPLLASGSPSLNLQQLTLAGHQVYPNGVAQLAYARLRMPAGKDV